MLTFINNTHENRNLLISGGNLRYLLEKGCATILARSWSLISVIIMQDILDNFRGLASP